jgi:hypothetical protein
MTPDDLAHDHDDTETPERAPAKDAVVSNTGRND